MVIVKILFPGDEEWTSLTEHIRQNSVKTRESLFSEEYKSANDVLSFNLIYNKEIFTRLITTRESAQAFAIDTETGEHVATGIIAGTQNLKMGEFIEDINLEIIDNFHLLEESFPESFVYLDHVICNSASPDNSLLHKLFTLYNIPHSFIKTMEIKKVVKCVTGTKDQGNARQLLDTLLHDNEYFITQEPGGLFSIDKWVSDDSIPEVIFDENDIKDSDFLIEEMDIDNKGVICKWADLSTKEDALLYRESVSYDNEGNREGVLLGPGEHYPLTGHLEDVYQNFRAKWLDDPYLSSETVLQNKDISLMATWNHRINFDADEGIVLVSEEHENLRSKTLFKNNTNEIKKLYFFDIHGTALFRNHIRETKSEKAKGYNKPYVTTYVFDKDTSEKLTAAKRNKIKHSNIKVSLYSTQDVPKGKKATIRSKNEFQAVGRIRGKIKQFGENPFIKYVLEIAEPILFNGITTSSIAPQQSTTVMLEALLRRSLKGLTKDEAINGFEGDGGTKVPDYPSSIKTKSLLNGVEIAINKQSNLTNFKENHFQVSEDMINWHAPNNTGSKLGQLNSWASTPSEYYVHSNLINENSTPVKLFYRARRATKDNIYSPWSNAIEGKTSLSEGAGMALNTVGLNHLKAGVMEAGIGKFGGIDSKYLSITGEGLTPSVKMPPESILFPLSNNKTSTQGSSLSGGYSVIKNGRQWHKKESELIGNPEMNGIIKGRTKYKPGEEIIVDLLNPEAEIWGIDPLKTPEKVLIGEMYD